MAGSTSQSSLFVPDSRCRMDSRASAVPLTQSTQSNRRKRIGNPAYFQNMSVWAGDSQGFKHVRMRLPGMAASTVQLRFEYTQDSFAICSDVRPGHTCGVSVDNIVVKSVKSVVP